MSYAEILQEIKVSKSSLSLWLRDVPLSEEDKARHMKRHIAGVQPKAVTAMIEKYKKIREKEYSIGKKLALDSSNTLMVLGCGLYWAEGTKSRNIASLANTCPELAKKFFDFLVLCVEIPKESICIEFIYHGDEGNAPPEESQVYWSNVFGVEREKVKATKNRDKRPRTGRKKNRHLHGMALVSVYKTGFVSRLYGAMEICTGKVFNFD